MHVYAGTDALLILGTTSEASTLTDDEKDEVVSFTHSITVKTDGMLTFDKKFSIKNSTETIIFVTIDTSECKAERKITDYGRGK